MRRAGLALVVLLLCACGAAPVLPPLDPAKARLVFYRNDWLGGKYLADALLNGERVGRTDLRGVYFWDVPPGSYAVTTMLSARVVHFSVAPGERKYIRFTTDFRNPYTYPELVEPEQGARESAGLERLETPKK